MMVKLASEPSLNDLDRIQDLFPVDDLLLYESDPLSPRIKSPSRKRSSTTSRLQRALSGKNKVVPTEKNGEREVHHNDVISNGSHDLSSVSSSSLLQFQHFNCSRRYVMEASVQLISGVQSQERHLFLLNDLLIIAKSRASGFYKLKEKVRVAELWLSNSCLEVVCEVVKNGDTAFVMGWPTTNVVVNFSSSHTRDLWLSKLKQLISEEQQKGPESTSIRVHYWDPNTKEEYAHNVTVLRKDHVIDCIGNTLQQLGLGSEDVNSYQLWVKTDRDTSPYPLIGHESPLAIKMNCLLTALAVTGEDAFDLSYCRSINLSNCPALKCYFILRSTKRGSFDLVPAKKGKRVKRAPILPKVFRRSLSKPELSESPDSLTNDQLFGQPLAKLISNGQLPKTLMAILYKLYETGPYTVGIFRKSANARVCRELREKLNRSNEDCSDELGETNIFVLAVLIKDFLRSLPDCLLMCQLYLEWLAIPCLSTDALKIKEARRLINRLPSGNEMFLRHFTCVLWHVQNRCSENMMTAANLAVCVGPSLLWSKECGTPTYSDQSEASKQVPTLVEFLVINCRRIFGEECLTLFNNAKQRDISRQDSGNEESESLHSLQSSHSCELRRDDSSIDSLERAIMGDGEHSPKLPTKAKMSLTNLSRDSGLTMSDTQLYTPDEEVDCGDSTILNSESTLTRMVSNSPPIVNEVKSVVKENNSPKRLMPNAVVNWSQCSNSGRSPTSNCNGSQMLEPIYWSGNSVMRVESSSVESNDLKSVHETNTVSHSHYGECMQDVKKSSHRERVAIDAGSSGAKSQFPLGNRKEVIKRRLSRSRPWVRPMMSCNQESSVFHNHDVTLRRSASDESIASNACHGFIATNEATSHLPASYATPNQWLHVGRNPLRTNGSAMPCNMSRSKSVMRFTELDESNRAQYLRNDRTLQRRFITSSQSLAVRNQRHSSPHPELATDITYDSSTLSDDDSTPRISRNNSRGKEDNYAAMMYSSIYNNTSLVNMQVRRTVGYDDKMKLVDSEIHHALPIRIDTSDEELDIPPPLPPKPLRLKSGDYFRSISDGFDDESDWNLSARGRIPAGYDVGRTSLHDTTVIRVGGQRVLAATAQNIYDVPPWKPDTTSTRQSRSATISRSTHIRAKSQPPPQNRVHTMSNGYSDMPSRSVINHQSDNTMYSRGSHVKSKEPSAPWKQSGGTVGRTLKKELSWSVSQLKALFSRNNKYNCNSCDEPVYDQRVRPSTQGYNNLMFASPPPPYRPPPSFIDGDDHAMAYGDGKYRTNQKPEYHWASTLRRNKNWNKLKLTNSSSESQGSVSGEESYV